MLKKSAMGLPEWVKHEDDPCLRDNAEEAYVARALAMATSAARKASSRGVYKSAMECLRRMGDARLGLGARRSAGERAYELFVEARERARTRIQPGRLHRRSDLSRDP